MFELHAVMAENARRSSQNTSTVMEALLVNTYNIPNKNIILLLPLPIKYYEIFQ